MPIESVLSWFTVIVLLLYIASDGS